MGQDFASRACAGGVTGVHDRMRVFVRVSESRLSRFVSQTLCVVVDQQEGRNLSSGAHRAGARAGAGTRWARDVMRLRPTPKTLSRARHIADLRPYSSRVHVGCIQIILQKQ